MPYINYGNLVSLIEKVDRQTNIPEKLTTTKMS